MVLQHTLKCIVMVRCDAVAAHIVIHCDGVAAQSLDPWEPRHGTNLGPCLSLTDATGGAWRRYVSLEHTH